MKSETAPTVVLLPTADLEVILFSVILFSSRAVEAAVVTLVFEPVRAAAASSYSFSYFSNLLLRLIFTLVASTSIEFFSFVILLGLKLGVPGAALVCCESCFIFLIIWAGS